MEHARNVVGLRDADFEETSPASPTLIITRLMRPIAGFEQEVFIAPDTIAFKAYGKNCATEKFTCNYGLNESYRNDVVRDNLRVVGKDREGNARIIELSSHPFFVAPLFLPQLSSEPGNPHPIIVAFLQSAEAFRSFRGTKT